MGEFYFRPIAVLPFAATLCLFMSIIFYLWKAKRSPQLYSLLVLQSLMLLWSAGQTVQYCSASNRVTIFTIYLIHTAVAFLGLAWFIFTLYFSSANGTINLYRIAPLGIPSLLFYLIFLTNRYHHFYFQTVRYDPRIVIYAVYGPYYWFGAFVTYGLVITGIANVAKYASGQTGVIKKQAFSLLLAPVLSLSVSFVGSLYFFFIAKVNVLELFDPTPSLFAVFVFFFSVAIFKYRYLDINPGALKRVFENLHYSIIVVDNFNCIVNINGSLRDNFGLFSQNEKISSLVNKLRDSAVKTENATKIIAAIEFGTDKTMEMGELYLAAPVNKIYEVVIQRLDYHHEMYRGRIVIFHDITEYKLLHEELDLKNHELTATNQQLSGHLQTVEELAIAIERNRLAREVHDTLGHSLTVLIMLMKAAKIEAENAPENSAAQLSEGIKVAQTELNELRRSINGLISPDLRDPDMIDNLYGLVRQTETLGVNVELSVFVREIYDRMPASIYKLRFSDSVYKICKEAITNSLRHGAASRINIIAKFSPGKLQLFIIDNGRGCPKIVNGFGLQGMVERIKELKGDIKFGSDGESGFNIHAEMPVGES